MHRKDTIIILAAGLLTTIVGVVLGWYLSSVYQRPEIGWYSGPYYKIDDVAIGNIILFNVGRVTDRNISITLDSAIKNDDIKIVDLVCSYKILQKDNKTTVVIEELKPGEIANITFKDDVTKDYAEITNFVSEYSNVVEFWPVKNVARQQWGNPSLFEFTNTLIPVTLGGVVGYLFFRTLAV